MLTVVAIANDTPVVFAAGLLADHGAMVILVERRESGSRLRSEGRRLPWNSSLLFESEARGTFSIALDIADPADREVMLRIAEAADIVIEDLGKGVLEAAGLAPEALLRRRPGLGIIRVSPYGQTGPLSDLEGDDRTAQAFSGVAFCTGFTEDFPQPHRVPIASYWTGFSVANAALLCALSAGAGGTGEIVDLALYESALRCQEEMLVQFDQLGELKTRMGNEYSESAPSSMYQTADGDWVVCAAANNNNFARICEAMGRAELTSDPRFATPAKRVENRVAINAVIEGWAQTMSTGEVVKLVQSVGAPATPLKSFADVIRDEQIKIRRSFVPVEIDEARKIVVPGVVPKFQFAPGAIARRAPRLDEHREFVLSWLAGLRPREPRDGRQPDRGPSGPLPLSGLRVLDLGRFVAAQVTPVMLAEFGADVIKIELPIGPAATRNRLPSKDGISLSNVMYQRGKRAMTLDIRQPEGRKILLALAAESDVLIENFRPGTMERWGLGPEALLQANPRLVVTRLSGFGQKGPKANLPAFDPVAIVTAGGMSIVGGAGGTMPLRPGPLLADYSATLLAFFGTLCALRVVQKHGQGEVVDLALYEAVARILGDIPARYAEDCELHEKASDSWTAAADWWVGKAKDDHYILISRWPESLDRVGDVLGLTGGTAAKIAALEQWVTTVPALTAEDKLRAGGLLCSRVMSAAELIDHPHLLARHNVVTREHYRLGPVRQQGVIPRLSHHPGRVTTSEVPYGMHTEAILSDVLGYGGAELSDLRSAHVI
jgi:crotonobetainyl-CoA:carnitine CoA-transferase CaiB-like acyl-CoA transferase